MTKVKLVTGYVPIRNHPRSAEEYGRLGDELAKVKVPLRAFYAQVENCWLYKMLLRLPYTVTHSVADNPTKNTLEYHIVNHQKTAWLLDASLLDPGPDIFVWVDYGIMHLPGVTPQVIEDFAAKVGGEDIQIPGCWTPRVITDEGPCWRFCGSVLICPRNRLHELNLAVQASVLKHVQLTKNVSWEVNTWARVEEAGRLPIEWYKADHNATLFTDYRPPNAQI